MLEAVGPGHRAPVRARARRRPARHGPARPRLPRPARRPPRRCCAAAGWAPRRWPSGRTSCSARGEPAPALLGFRDADARARAPTLLHNARVATDDGSHGHHGLVTDLLADELDAGAAGRRLRLRPAADARGGARAVRGARRPLPARARVGHGVRLRRLLRLRRGRCAPAATCACASTGRSSTAPCSRRCRRIDRGGAIDFCGLRLAHPIVNGSGTFDAIAARRAFGDALLEQLPVRGLRLQDDHAGAARRQPAAAAVRDPGRPDQLDRPAQQGPARLPRARPARARAAAGAAHHQRHGLDGGRAVRARRGARRARRGRRARAQRLLPERVDRASTSAPTPPSWPPCWARCARGRPSR